MFVFKFVVYVIAVAALASNTIFHLDPFHSIMSFALATVALRSVFCQATGDSVASSLPTSSNSNNRYRSLSMNSNSSISAKPEQNYISINIAYIANGWGHNDRTPCWIVLSDYNGNIIFDEKINPLLSKTFCDITSTLEPLTGITIDILEKEGKSYNQVINNISKFFGKGDLSHECDFNLDEWKTVSILHLFSWIK